MKKISQSQRGSTTMIALSVMLIALGLLAAVSSIVNANMAQSRYSKNTIQAQYAAEAGVKHFVVSYNEGKSANWDWLGAEKKNKLSQQDNTFYTVVITDKQGRPALKSDGTAIENIFQATAGDYMIQSIGMANGKRRVVKREITVSIENNFPDYAAYCYGSSNYNSTEVKGAPVGYFGAIDTNPSFIGEKEKTLNVRQPQWGEIKDIIKQKESGYGVKTSLPEEGEKLSGVYVVEGWKVKNKKLETDKAGAEVYVKKSLDINHTTFTGDLLFVANNVSIHNSDSIDRAVIIASSLSVNNSDINGALLSAGSISMNNSKLTYDKDLIKFFHIKEDYGKIFYSSEDPNDTTETNKEVIFKDWSKNNN